MAIPAEVVGRFALKNGMGWSEADELFRALDTFLERAAHEPIVPDQTIDLAWHEFILHTREYYAYCLDRFGALVHHVPTSPVAKPGQQADDEAIKITAGALRARCESGPSCSSSCRSG